MSIDDGNITGNSYQYDHAWQRPQPEKVVTKTTTTREYDAKGNLIKETVETVTETCPPAPHYPYITNNDQAWWWQNPLRSTAVQS